MIDALYSMLVFLLIAAAAFGLGRPLARRLRIADVDPLGVSVWSLALGLLMAGSLFVVAAWLGCFGLPLAAAVSLLGCLWGATELACDYLGRWPVRMIALSAAPEPGEMTQAAPVGLPLVVSLAVVAAVATLATAFVPPVSPEALAGSLESAKNLVLAGDFYGAGSGTLRGLNLVEAWFAWALTLDGPIAANLLHWGLGVLLAAAGAVLARPLLGPSAALFAAGLILLCPGVQQQMAGLPVADLGLAIFITLALAAAWQVLVQLESQGWAIVAGTMLGGALAVSPVAMLFAATLGGVWTVVAWSRAESRHELTRAAGRSAIAASLVAAPWPPCWLAPRFGEPQPPVSVVAHVGPLLLLLLPGLAFARRLRGLNVLLAAAAAYGLLACWIPTPVRWWSCLIPVLSVASVWVWQEVDRLSNMPGRLVRAAAAVLLVAAPAISVRKMSEVFFAAPSGASRSAYVATHAPTFRAASVYNRISRPGDRLLSQDPRTFYFECPAEFWPDFDSPVAGGDREAQLVAAARARGFTHVLSVQNGEGASSALSGKVGQGPQAQLASPTDDELLPPGDDLLDAGDELQPPGEESSPASGQAHLGGEVLPILEYRSADDNNRPIRYRLLRVR